METLYSFDISVFILLNQYWTLPILDWSMPILTDFNQFLAFRIAAVGLVLFAVILDGARGRWAALTLVVTIVLSDQVNSFVIKELFARPRPCLELADVRLLVDCGGGKSFPSSHAVNTFAAALVIGYFYPRSLWYLVGLAGLISYSRVYVGVHYPLDVAGGAVLGTLWGLGTSSIVPVLRGRIRPPGDAPKTRS